MDVELNCKYWKCQVKSIKYLLFIILTFYHDKSSNLEVCTLSYKLLKGFGTLIE